MFILGVGGVFGKTPDGVKIKIKNKIKTTPRAAKKRGSGWRLCYAMPLQSLANATQR
jgi:hypothetical protein